VASPAPRAVLAAAAALALVTAARLPAAWESGNALNHVSGVWLALADDLARGTLYRPLEADGRYGGTRYFPLVFALEAGLAAGHPGPPARAGGLRLIGAGQAVSLAAGLLLVAGVAALLAAAGAGAAPALAAGVLALAGLAGQRALADARGDLLPVALSALALAAVARRGAAGPPRGGAATGAAALLLVVAFAAKPTALGAAAAAALALAARGARSAAATLVALVAAGCAAVVVATDALSSGRFLAALRACAWAGLDVRSAVAAPVRLATEAAAEDPAGLAVLVLGAAALAVAAPAVLRAARAGDPGDPRLVPALWLATAWATALVVYASPGTGVNHLVEPEAASAALLAATGLSAARRTRAAAAIACAVAAAAGVAGAIALWRADGRSSRLAELRAVVAALPPGPVVSEDPLVPLLAGTSPRVLDPFALRAAARAQPALEGSLGAALRAGGFAAVVLLADADGPGAAAWYARGNLGIELVEAIRAGYRPAGAFGRYHLYVPRSARTGPDAARATPADGVVRRDGAR
jgi:hypothetical protein